MILNWVWSGSSKGAICSCPCDRLMGLLERLSFGCSWAARVHVAAARSFQTCPILLRMGTFLIWRFNEPPGWCRCMRLTRILCLNKLLRYGAVIALSLWANRQISVVSCLRLLIVPLGLALFEEFLLSWLCGDHKERHDRLLTPCSSTVCGNLACPLFILALARARIFSSRAFILRICQSPLFMSCFWSPSLTVVWRFRGRSSIFIFKSRPSPILIFRGRGTNSYRPWLGVRECRDTCIRLIHWWVLVWIGSDSCYRHVHVRFPCIWCCFFNAWFMTLIGGARILLLS